GTLGLEKEDEVQTPFGTVHRLRYGTSVVKLMDPKQVPPAGPIGLEKQLGIRYLSFVNRDLGRVCTVLKEKGVEFTMPETHAYRDGQRPGRQHYRVQRATLNSAARSVDHPPPTERAQSPRHPARAWTRVKQPR